ncbi:hypothetical protein MMC11_001872 [Xylographa trunciseda]|nr:hypothetical protein [Xylographa trunciseda]
MGRGNPKFHYPSSNPTVTIGLTVSTSSPVLCPTSPSPFFVTVSARILTSPHPASPITLCTHLNPLSGLHNRCFGNIVCVSPSAQTSKHIEIWPGYWARHVWNPRNLRDALPFITLRPHEPYEVKFEVRPEKIAAANPVVGEKYRVELTDKGMGTKWWAFGAWEDDPGMRYRTWKEGGDEGGENEEEEDEEEGDEDGEDEKGRYTMGEDPQDLALVAEKGEAIFEIG